MNCNQCGQSGIIEEGICRGCDYTNRVLAWRYLQERYADQVSKYPTLAETGEVRYCTVNLPFVMANEERMNKLRAGDFTQRQGLFA